MTSARWSAPIAAAAAAFVLAACGSSGGGRPAGGGQLVGHVRHSTVDPHATDDAVAGEQALALAFLHEASGRQASGNGTVATSPANLALALAMLHDGADGTTRREIEAVLHTRDAALDPGWLALSTAWAATARHDGIDLATANALWVQHGFPVRPGFLDALRTYYRTGVQQTDFSTAAAVQAINRWTAQHTRGRITKLFDQLDASTRLVLADAVYFKARWEQPFDSHLSRPGPFTTDDGTRTTVTFMHADDADADSAVGEGYEAAQLPYRGGRFAALLVTPTSGTLADFVRTLSPARLRAIVASLRSVPLNLAVPRFTVRTTLDLRTTLQHLGMTSAFGPQADFSRMTSESVQVSQAVQRVYLRVSERGTEAAAVTGVAIASSARVGPARSIAFDHPFLFLIRDTTTGAVLFAATIARPAT